MTRTRCSVRTSALSDAEIRTVAILNTRRTTTAAPAATRAAVNGIAGPIPSAIVSRPAASAKTVLVSKTRKPASSMAPANDARPSRIIFPR